MKSRFARKGIFVSALLLAFSSLPMAAMAAQSTKDNTIVGLGMALPNVPDVSQSKNFHVYEMHQNGITYVQVNDLSGKVVTAVAMTNGGYFPIPIGYLASTKVTLPNGLQYGIVRSDSVVTPMAEGDGQCPCGGQIVYSGPRGTIVVVTDKNGNVIQVVVLQPVAK